MLAAVTMLKKWGETEVRTKIRQLGVLLLVSLVLVLAACSNSKVTEENTPPAESSAPSETPGQPASEPAAITITDGVGKEVTLDKKPERIISLMPSNTEILYALGVGDQVVGVTELCNYPEDAATKAKVSDSFNVNVEEVVALKPDVVFAYTMGQPEAVQKLEELGLKVVTIKSAANIDDVYSDIELMAKVTGTEDKAKEIIAGMKQKLEGIVSKVSGLETKKRVYLEISPSPDIWTAGSGTFQDELLKLIGVENIFSDVEGWANISEEAVIAAKPDIILTTVGYAPEPEKEIMGRSPWRDIPAIKNNQVFYVDSDLTTRPGPRIIDGVEVLFEAVYPELK